LASAFEALAVIKYYELRNDRVLVIVPKKLRENWTIYTINDKRNLLATDRFNYDVLNHTDMTRIRGMSGEINLDTLTIARSRKHIEKYYDIAEIGEFPERLKPVNIKEDIDLEGGFPALREINRTIRRLNLSAYSPLKYVKIEKREEYSRKYDVTVKSGSVFKQVDREQSLIHLMRVNLLKRMESSTNSFALTLEKLLATVDALLEKIENHDDTVAQDLNIEDIEIDSPDFEALLIGNKIKVLLKDIDQIHWKQDLEDDRIKLAELLQDARGITAERDAKLHHLKAIISHKCAHPLNVLT